MKLLIVLILLLNLSLYNCSGENRTISKNGVTLIYFEVTNTILNWTSNINPSTTFNFGIQKQDILNVSGSVTFSFDNSLIIPFSQGNIYNQSSPPSDASGSDESIVYITICLPITSLNGCGLTNGQESAECTYTIGINDDNGDIIYFFYQEITTTFPGTTLNVYQNLIPPKLQEFNVNIHDVGPLVTLEFAIKNYGRGLYKIQVEFSNTTTYQNTLELYEFQTSNGFYYIEFLLALEVTGYQYIINSIDISDYEGNYVEYTTSQLQSIYDVSGFNISNSIYPNDNNLFTFTSNTPTIVQSTEYTVMIVDITLSNYLYPIIGTSDLSFCTTYYQSSTTLKLYCTIPPYQESDQYCQLSFNCMGGYSVQSEIIPFNYVNSQQKQIPTILDVTYSVEEINGFDLFYIETNVSFQTESSVFLRFDFELPSKPSLFINNLVSGNTSFGVVSGSWIFDASIESLVAYKALLTDSKLQFTQPILKGPKTMKKIYGNDISFNVMFTMNQFDLKNYSTASIPFIIETSSQDSDNIIASGFIFDVLGVVLPSANTAHNGTYGTLLYSNGTESTYHSFTTISSSDIYSNVEFSGDFLLRFFAETHNHLYEVLITSQCFTIQPPLPLVTLVTDLILTPPSPINSIDNSLVYIYFETKGDSVDAATIFIYSSLDQAYLISYESFYNCSLSTPYNYNTLITGFMCSIPIYTLPSQTFFFYIQLNIHGVETIIYNSILQESGYPSYIQISGPSDNTQVPIVTKFDTSFDTSNNSITIKYSVENPSTFAISEIDFFIFNRDIPMVYSSTNEINQIKVSTTFIENFGSSNGTISFSLCDLEGFQYFYQNIGIYISIPSSISGVFYQFPYEILVELDSNKQQFPINLNGICDFAPPRLVDMGVLYPDAIYDTTDSDIMVTLYFDITDDVSGFGNLNGYITSNGTDDLFLFQSFSFNSGSLHSGNYNNGRYYYNLTIGQYTSGTYLFSVEEIYDYYGNVRSYTLQNIEILFQQKGSDSPYFITTYSAYSDPNLPTLQDLSVANIDTKNTIIVEITGLASQVSIHFDSSFSYPIQLQPLSNSTYQKIDILPWAETGQYYYSLCLTSKSFSIKCYNWKDLGDMGFQNFLVLYNPYYNSQEI